MRASLFLVLALVACAYCNLELLHPKGRGFVSGDNGHGPCGQANTQPAGKREQWEHGACSERQCRVDVGGNVRERWEHGGTPEGIAAVKVVKRVGKE